jgi:hypothetical protein
MVNTRFKSQAIQRCVTMPVDGVETMWVPCSELGNHESTTPSKIRYLSDGFAHPLTLIGGARS